MSEHGDPIQIGIEIGTDFTRIDAALAKLQATINRNIQAQNSFANRFRVTGDAVGHAIQSGAQTAERSLRRLSSAGSSVATALSKSFGQVHRTLASVASGVQFGAGVGIGISAVDMLKQIPGLLAKSLGDGAELKSIEQRLQRTFGRLVDDAREFARDFSKQVGTAETDTKAMLARFAASLEQTNVDPQKRAAAAKTMARLASDMAAAWGTDQHDAADAMMAALRGEADPIERYALNLKEAAVNAKLLQMGIAGGSRTATEAQKVMARFNIIVEQTKNIHGLAAHQASGYTKELGRISLGWKTMSEKIGLALEPAATHVAKFIADTMPKIETAMGPVDQLGVRMLEVSKQWTEALAPMREQFVQFIGSLPEGIGQATEAIESMTKSLQSLRDMLGSAGLDSLNGNWAEWIRGRARGDDVKALTLGSEAVNAGNQKLREYASIPTSSEEQREESLSKARVPLIRKMSYAITDAMSWMLGATHGRTPQAGQSRDAGPAAGAVSPSTPTEATQVPRDPPASTTSPTQGYEQLTQDKPKGPQSSFFLRMQEALRVTTGVDLRSTPWDKMSVAEKRKKMFELNARGGGEDRDAIMADIATMDGPELDRLLGFNARRELELKREGKTLDGGIGKDIEALRTPIDQSSPFTASSGPFDRLGSIMGNLANAFTGATKVGINAFADPEKVADEMANRPRVSYMGLQDLQKSLQSQLGEDEAKKDRLKLEQAKKQTAAAENAADRLKEMPSKLALELSRLVGLQ